MKVKNNYKYSLKYFQDMFPEHELILKFNQRRYQEQCSSETLRSYSEKFKSWVAFLGDCGKTDLCQADEDDVRQYLVARRETGLSDSTIRGDHRALHALYEYAWHEGMIQGNFISRVSKPKIRVIKDDPPFTAEEIVLLLEAIPKRLINHEDRWIDNRDAALISLLFDTGCRVSAVARVLRKDLDVEARTFSVIEKGGRRKKRAFGLFTQQLLQEHLKTCPASEFVFMSKQNAKPGSCVKASISRSGIYQVVRKLCDVAGIPRRQVHSLRSGFACDALAVMDMSEVQSLLGHYTPIMTQHYSRHVWHDNTLQKQLDHSPMDRATGTESQAVNLPDPVDIESDVKETLESLPEFVEDEKMDLSLFPEHLKDKPACEMSNDDWREVMTRVSHGRVAWLSEDPGIFQKVTPLIDDRLSEANIDEKASYYQVLYSHLASVCFELITNCGVTMGHLSSFIDDYVSGFKSGFQYGQVNVL